MLDAVTVLVAPTVFVAKVGVPLTVKVSPEMRSSEYVTVAVVVPSYVLLLAAIDTSRGFGAISAVVVGEPVSDNV